MFLRTEIIQSKKLIGLSVKTNLANEPTDATIIWKQLMPYLKKVNNRISTDLISLQVFNFQTFSQFTSQTYYQKYALIEVSDFNSVPHSFETFELKTGNYAVFLHKGTAAELAQTSQYIYSEWLPQSNYTLDNRPHFAIMGKNYLGHNNPESEEEIWIPIS